MTTASTPVWPLAGESTASSRKPIELENMRGQLLANGLVMLKHGSENHGRRSNHASQWRRVSPGRRQIFHQQGTARAMTRARSSSPERMATARSR